MPDEVKKRGRPPLSPEEKEAHRIAKNKRDSERSKANGYIAQKKYRSEHYVVRFGLPIKSKETLEDLLHSEGMTAAQMFCHLVYEKYGILLEEGAKDKE